MTEFAEAGSNSAGNWGEAASVTDHKTCILWAQWKRADKELRQLARLEDKLIQTQQEIPEAIDTDTAITIKLQEELIGKLFRIKSRNLYDIAIKLNIWLDRHDDSGAQAGQTVSAESLAFQAVREMNGMIEDMLLASAHAPS